MPSTLSRVPYRNLTPFGALRLVHRGLSAEGGAAAGFGLPDALLPAPWGRIMAGARDCAGELGFHTVWHANLSALNEAGLDEELGRPRREIRQRTGRDVQTVAYPYRLWNQWVLGAAARAGYRIGLRVDSGLFEGDQIPIGVARINVPAGISADALACWAAGIRPRRP